MSNNLPLVTIGIPTFNRANGYLKLAIGASLRQTYPNIEIVVSDNHSSDNTEDIVNEFRDSRIKYFRQTENIGMSNNFNFCIKQARGEYFCLLPDDDLIDDDFIAVCMDGVRQRPGVGIVRTGTRIINGDGYTIAEYPNRTIGSSAEDLFLSWFSGITSPYMCSSLMNRQKLVEIGGYNSKLNLWQDVGAEFQLAAKFGEHDIYDIKGSFRKHSEEITFSSNVSNWCDDSLALLKLLMDLVPEKRELIRSKGLPFLANINYNRAKAVQSVVLRIFAFIVVYKKFGYRYKPSKKHLLG